MKNDKLYIEHIIKSIKAITSYTAGFDEKSFLSNGMVADAVIRNFQIIGEATKRISKQTRDNYPQIPWSKMAGLRDKLIHDYVTIDLQLIWDVIVDLLPEHQIELEKILANLSD